MIKVYTVCCPFYIFWDTLSQLMRLWYLSHRRPAKAQASLIIRTVSPEPSLFCTMSLLANKNRWVNLSRLMTKPTKWHVRPAKIQISLGICPFWSESSPSAWRKLGSLARIRLGRCPGWSESSLGAHAILLVLSWGGSILLLNCTVDQK